MNPLADPACPACRGSGNVVLDPEDFPPTRIVICACVLRRAGALAAVGQRANQGAHSNRRSSFRPGLSRFAEDADGNPARCGICAARLELRSTVPALEVRGGQMVGRWDYECADHGGLAGRYFEAAEDAVEAAA